MKKTDIQISILTLLIGRPKGHKTNKFLYFNDNYILNDIPVVEKNEFQTFPNSGVSLVGENQLFVPVSYESGIKENFCLEHRFYVVAPTVANSIPINYSNKSLISPSKYDGHYFYGKYEEIPELKEIIYDERKEIEAKLQLAKKDFVLVKKDKNVFRLFVNFNLPHNNIHNHAVALDSHIKTLFIGDISVLNKNTYIPDYMAHEVLKQFVLYSAEILLSDNSFEFSDLNIAIKQKLNQVEIIKIIKKHYGDDDICKTVDLNISKSLYNHKSLKKEFIIEFVDFYKQNYNLSQEIRDNAEYLLEKCYGKNLGLGFCPGTKF